MRVEAVISEVDVEMPDGNTVAGVCAACTRCDHITESGGTSEASIRRCLALLRESCPAGESNFYVEEDT